MAQKATLVFEDVEGEEADNLTMEMRFEPGVEADRMASGDLDDSATLRAVRDVVEFVHRRSGKVNLVYAETSDTPNGGGERWRL